MYLGLDTSTLTLSIALVERPGADQRVAAAELWGPPEKQSILLPKVIDQILRKHGVSLAQLRGIAVALGPGSFTGLRIGLATAKSLAYVLRIPLVGASSLAACAMEGQLGQLLCPLTVARKGELYTGTYRRTEQGVQAIGDEEALALVAIASRLRQDPNLIALGPAIPPYGDEFKALGVSEAQLARSADVPKAERLTQLVNFPSAFELKSLFSLEPKYVRPSEAERNPRYPPIPGVLPIATIRE